MRRIRAVLVVSVSVVALLLGLSQSSATPQGSQFVGTGWVRLGGPDRYDTAVAVSQATFPESSAYTSRVVVATGEDFPDSLAASALAAVEEAPLLLVRKNSVPATVANEIRRLRPDQILIVGGTGAVSSAVETELRGLLVLTDQYHFVERLGGRDRYETAAAVAQSTYFLWSEGYPPGDVVIANGDSYADAMVGAGMAALHEAPIIFSTKDRLPRASEDFLRLPDVPWTSRHAYIIGGTGVVSDAVAATIRSLAPLRSDTRFTVLRYSGPDRYATAAAVASALKPHWDGRTIMYATGENFPDGLTAGAASHSASGVIPLLLTKQSCMPRITAQITQQFKPALQVVVGQSDVAYAGGRVC